MFGKILILLHITYSTRFERDEMSGVSTIWNRLLAYRGGNCGETYDGRVLFYSQLLFHLQNETHLHFLITTVCNFATIALFILACARNGRPPTDRPHEYSYKQLNCARRKICTLHKLYGAVAASRSPLPKDKIFSFDMETRYYHNVIVRFDSVSCFNQCDKSNTLRPLIRSRSQI